MVEPEGLLARSRQRPWLGLQSFLLASTMLAIAHRMPTAKIALPNTKTCGGMPILVAPYTQTGNGTEAPLTKFDVTKSSMEIAKAIRAPAMTPGLISGKVIFLNVTHAFAPRSSAASSRDRSKPASRALTVTVT